MLPAVTLLISQEIELRKAKQPIQNDEAVLAQAQLKEEQGAKRN